MKNRTGSANTVVDAIADLQCSCRPPAKGVVIRGRDDKQAPT